LSWRTHHEAVRAFAGPLTAVAMLKGRARRALRNAAHARGLPVARRRLEMNSV
jgi:hypothetical protein